MIKFITLTAWVTLLGLISTRAASTINAANHYAWGANIGWTNWLPSSADGVIIGEYICTGYIYGANIGWINFESLGNPRLSLFTGTFSGYAYSANCGWINLNDVLGKVQTDHLAMGVDSDGDGIADAFEYQYFGNLVSANATSDQDGDGISDKDEYLDGTSPILSSDKLRITTFATSSGSTTSTVTWTSTTARLYLIETKPDLLQVLWDLDPTFGAPFSPDVGTSTTRMPARAASETKRFYRVKSIKPLP